MERVEKVVRTFPSRFDEYEDLLTKNRIWLARTQGVGLLTASDAIALGVSGPSLRGSGVDTTSVNIFRIRVMTNLISGARAHRGRLLCALFVPRRGNARKPEDVRQAMEKIPSDGPIRADAPASSPRSAKR